MKTIFKSPRSIQEGENFNLIKNEGNEYQFQLICWALYHACLTLPQNLGQEGHTCKWSLYLISWGLVGALVGKVKRNFRFLLYEYLYCLNFLTMSTHFLSNNKINQGR